MGEIRAPRTRTGLKSQKTILSLVPLLSVRLGIIMWMSGVFTLTVQWAFSRKVLYGRL